MTDANAQQALYRTWRPKTFGDMVGQDALVRTLKNAVRAGHVAHAYLFSGERGIGKTSAARILARAVNCLEPQEGEPCNACANCRTVLANRTLDIVEIDGASNRGIDHIRQLREEVSFVPSDLRMKVYIIDEVHMLTNEAFNALLKTLEEPPSHSMFVFATTEPHKVPRTIVSRCQTFEFRRIDAMAIMQHLQKVAQSLGLDVARDALDLIAQRANGGMRDALVMLEQAASFGGDQISADDVLDVLGLADGAVHEALISTIQRGDQATLVSLIDELVDRGKDLEVFLSDVVALLRARLRVPSAQSAGEILLSRGLLEIKADMFRSMDRRIRFEIGLLGLMESVRPRRPEQPRPPAEGLTEDLECVAGAGQDTLSAAVETQEKSEGRAVTDGAEPPRSRTVVPEECRRPWDRMLEEIQQDRIAIAAYLVEATPQLVGDQLMVSFHPEHSFHKESLEIRENRTYLAGAVRRHFGDRIRVEIRTDDAVSRKPLPHEALMEKARLVCEAVDGKIVKEEL